MSPRSAIAYFVAANVAQSGQRPKCTRCTWENAGTVPRRVSATGAVRMWPVSTVRGSAATRPESGAKPTCEGHRSNDVDDPELPSTRIINTLAAKYNITGQEESKQSFVIDPLKTETITTADGTKIEVPANSLVYANGTAVKGPVNLTFNPYYSLAEIATSGIHMNYKQQQEESPFKSAGMFSTPAIRLKRRYHCMPVNTSRMATPFMDNP